MLARELVFVICCTALLPMISCGGGGGTTPQASRLPTGPVNVEVEIKRAVGALVIDALAETENGQPSMKFYVDDRFVGTCPTNPYYFTLSPRQLPWGHHTFLAAAFDAEGQVKGISDPGNSFENAPVLVYPESPKVVVNQTRKFIAADVENKPLSVAWSILEGPTGGTIDTQGLYTAPSVAGTFHVIATSAVYPANPGIQTVQVLPPAARASKLPSASASPAPSLALSLTGGRIVSVAWSVPTGTPGPVQINRILQPNGSPKTIATSSSVDALILDDFETLPGAKYAYELMDSAGVLLATSTITLPILTTTSEEASLHWDLPGVTGSATLMDFQGNILQTQNFGIDLVFKGLAEHSNYFVETNLSDGTHARFGFQSLPAKPCAYATPYHLRPGEILQVAINNPNPSKQVELLIKRTNPQPSTLLKQTLTLPTIPSIYDGPVYGYRWPNALSWQVPSDAESGEYYVSVGFAGENSYSRFAFVVEPGGASTSKLLVVASTNTWQAYNLFGGVSFYANDIQFPFPRTAPEYGLNTPRPEVSFLRPFHTPWNDPLKYLDRASGQERFLLDWLDLNHYQYDLISEFAFASMNPLDLAKQYEAVIYQVHPEYWTANEESVLLHYIQLGGHLINLGGNVDYTQVGYEQNDSSRLVRLVRPSDFSTTGSIIGATSSESHDDRYGPFTIEDATNWVFHNLPSTSYPAGTFGNGGPLGGGSGDEVDIASQYSPTGVRILAQGSRYDFLKGQLLLFNSGLGSVFSATSIAFTSTLSSDLATQQILRNVLFTFAPQTFRLDIRGLPSGVLPEN